MNASFGDHAWRRALGALGPLDRARGAALGAAAPWARALLRDRGLRVAASGSVAVVFAFVLALTAPMALLAVGPLVLGVPHLVADLRYLVAKPGFHRRSAFWVAVVGPLGVVHSFPRAWVGLVCVLGAVAIARASVTRKVIAGLATGAVAYVAHAHVGLAEIVMAHAHNFVAIAMWAVFFQGKQDSVHRVGRQRRAIVITLFCAASLVIFLAPLPWPSAFAGVGIDAQARVLSPVTSPMLALRFVVFFAFAQSVHYAVWLRAIPDEARARPGVRTFASSARALREDVGALVMVVAAVVAAGLVVWGVVDLVHARLGYLRLATSHGYLELAVTMLFVLEARRR